MTIRKLLRELSTYNPDTEVILRCQNGVMDSTSAVDAVEEIVLDYEGTPGVMDDRLAYHNGKKVVAIVAEVEASWINK